MLKSNTKSLWMAIAGALIMSSSAFAQMGAGYQIYNGAARSDPSQAMSDNVLSKSASSDEVYICENGVFIGDFLSFDDPLGYNEASGFHCCGTTDEKTFAASLTKDCSSIVAETTFTPVDSMFYYISYTGNWDPDNQAPNPDGEDTALKIIVTETNANHASFPAGTPGLVYVTLAHLSPDTPNLTGIVQLTGTVLNVGVYGTVTPLPVPFPSILGEVDIDVYLEAQLAAGDTSNPIVTIPVNLPALDGRAVMAAVTGYSNPGASKIAGAQPLGVVAILDDGTVIPLAGGSIGTRTVSLWLNTATLSDTTDPTSLIEVRGAIDGEGPFELPDGNIIDWNDATTLEPENDGGDYWHIEFLIPDSAELAFKFFSEQAESVSKIGGWEDGDNHVIAAGTGDVDMGLHFFNKSGGNLDYDWRPYEEKADSIAIWFRSYLGTEDAITAGYDPRQAVKSIIGVRGDSVASGGVLDWGTTKVFIEQEGIDEAAPSWHLWSGVAYFPPESAGKTVALQNFKYFIQPDGWESQADNRTFTISASDTTIHWTYFSNSKVIGELPRTATVLFGVDLTPMEEIGIFDRARGDTLEIRGGFNGWNCDNPDDCLLDRVPGEPIFEAAVAITAVPNSGQDYKYFLNLNNAAFEDEFGEPPPSGWEEPITTQGANRTFTFQGNPDADQDLGIFFFNDILPSNILPGDASAGSKTAATIQVSFEVDMTEAINDPAQPFNPATDTVTIDFTGDAIWAFTQDVPRGGDGHFQIDNNYFRMKPTLTGNNYSGVFTLTGPTYAAIQYKYAYTQGDAFAVEQGGSTSGSGRRRTRFIPQNADGSFPLTWAFVPESYQPTGNLPFEDNPAVPTSVESVGEELPETIALGDNYPNPFNPSTTFEYSITATEYVQVSVYDLTGKLVKTLVDGVQPASTYRVSFDAQGLASGIYIYQLQTAGRTISKKMLLLK